MPEPVPPAERQPSQPKETPVRDFVFAGTATFEEYLECHKHLARKRRLWMCGVFLVYGAVMIALYPQRTPFVIAGAAMILYSLVISPALFRSRVRRLWECYPAIRQEFHITVNASGIDTRDDKGNPVHVEWRNMFATGETQSLFLLYSSPLLPLCLPKRLLPADALPEFRKLLASVETNKPVEP